MSEQNILVTINANYLNPLCAMLRSLQAASPHTVWTVYLAHSSLAKEHITHLLANLDPARCRLAPIRLSPALFADAPAKSRIPKEAYYRTIAFSYLPAHVSRILYLDPDIIILNTLDDLYQMPLGDKLIAGAPHLGPTLQLVLKSWLGMPAHSTYINSGVLLMNIAGLRAAYSAEDILNHIRKMKTRLLLEDQDVINSLFGGRILSIDPYLYNLDEKCYRRKSRPLQKNPIDLLYVRRHVKIVHYNSKHKPWNQNDPGKLGCFYEEYAADPFDFS